MPGQNIWTIHNNGGPHSTGNDLNGCHIVQTDDGYDLTQPNINNVMASSDSNPPSFDNVSYANLVWNIWVTSALTPGANDTGGWACELPQPRPEGDPTEEGTFTAQAGQQMDEDADAASSAKA